MRRSTEGPTGQAWLNDVPALLIFCGNNRRQRLWHEWRGKPFANDHLDAFFNASVDAGIALTRVRSGRRGAGARRMPDQRRSAIARRRSPKLLRLPQHVFPVAGLGVGWPAVAPKQSMRLPLDVTVHRNGYREGDVRGAIEGYDRRREAAQPYREQRSVEMFGKVGGVWLVRGQGAAICGAGARGFRRLRSGARISGSIERSHDEGRPPASSASVLAARCGRAESVALSVEGWRTETRNDVVYYRCASQICAAGSVVSYKAQPHRTATTLADFEKHHRGLADQNKRQGRIRDVRIADVKQRAVEGVRVLQVSREVDWADNTTTFTIELRLIGLGQELQPCERLRRSANGPPSNFEGFLRQLVNIAGIKG